MKRMQTLSLALLVVLLDLLLWMPGWADSPPLTPVTFTGFTGAGFAPNPAAGQLDSDSWAITGFSDGDLAFGGTQTTASTDYTRGSDSGGVTTGGIYAFTDVGSGGNTIIGVQPGNTDFRPGTITMRVQNTTGVAISDLYIAYQIWTLNNAGRSSSLNFSYSTDDTNYTPIDALDFTTPEAADGTPTWVSTPRSTTLTGINLANSNYVYLRWTSDDVGGTGSRDEYGLDNVQVRTGNPTAVSLRTLTASSYPSVVRIALAATILLGVAVIVSVQRRSQLAAASCNRLTQEKRVAESEKHTEGELHAHAYSAPMVIHETTLEIRAGSPLGIGLDGVDVSW